MSELRSLVRTAGPEKLQLQLVTRLVFALPWFRRIVLYAGRCRSWRARGCDCGVVVRMAGRRAGDLPGVPRRAAESGSEGGKTQSFKFQVSSFKKKLRTDGRSAFRNVGE